jgi:RNA exonuclease 1
MFLLHPNQMLDNDYRLPSYIEASSTPTIPGVDIASLPEALRDLLTKERDIPEFTEEEAMNGNGAYPSKFTKGDDGWIETPEATGPPLDGVYPVLSIDCEMVSPLLHVGVLRNLIPDCHPTRPGIGSYIHH